MAIVAQATSCWYCLNLGFIWVLHATGIQLCHNTTEGIDDLMVATYPGQSCGTSFIIGSNWGLYGWIQMIVSFIMGYSGHITFTYAWTNRSNLHLRGQGFGSVGGLLRLFCQLICRCCCRIPPDADPLIPDRIPRNDGRRGPNMEMSPFGVRFQVPPQHGTPQQPGTHSGSVATPQRPLLDQGVAIIDLNADRDEDDIHFVASPAPRVPPPGVSGPSTSNARQDEPRPQRRTAQESAAQTKSLAARKMI